MSRAPDPPRLEGWQASQGACSVMDPPSSAAAPSLPAPGPQRYTLGMVVGRGGMGVVRAAYDEVTGRSVALKELDPARVGDRAAAARLAREASLTARLDHPGVVAVHDAGRLADGRPFYTMRLVRGRSLAAALVEAPDLAARLALIRPLLAASEAVAAAHALGVVHRDLKPANILLGPHGETQVVDWGVAAPTPAAASAWASLPASDTDQARVGTPAYTAPEQARGEPPSPTHDVWSLGATLFELLSGAPPSTARDLTQAAAPSPPPPLTDAPPELAAIAARAMATQPAARYVDASAFAADLLAWFEGRRVSAFSYSRADLLSRAIRAWRAPLLVAGLGLGGVLAAVAWGWWSTHTALERAVQSEVAAKEARRLTELQLAHNLVDQAVSATLADARATAETLATRALQIEEDPRARGVLAAFGHSGRPRLIGSSPGPSCERSVWASDGAWLLCVTPGHLTRWQDGRVRWDAPLELAALDELPGAGVLVLLRDGDEVLLDATSGAPLQTLPQPAEDWVRQLSPRQIFVGRAAWHPPRGADSGCSRSMQLVEPSPDGARIAALCGDGSLVIGTPEAPAQRRSPTGFVGPQSGSAMAWTADGQLLIGALDGGLRLVDPDTGIVKLSVESSLGSISSIALSPDGHYAAIGGASAGIGLWSLRTGAWMGEVPCSRHAAFAFLPDGELIVHDGRIWRWRMAEPTPYRLTTSAGLADLAISPDGALVALAQGDGRVSVLRLEDGAPVRSVDLGPGVIKSVAFSPDGGRVAVVNMGTTEALILDLATGAVTQLAGHRRSRRVVWIDGLGVLATDMMAGLNRWADPDAERERMELSQIYVDLERASADSALAIGLDGQVLRLRAGATPAEVTRLSGAEVVAGGGGRIALGTDVEIRLLDATGQETGRIAVEHGGLRDLALSPDGTRLAMGRLDGRVLLWDTSSLALLAELPGHTERVAAVEFSPDGRLLLSAGWDQSARVWELGVLDRPAAELMAELETSWTATERVE